MLISAKRILSLLVFFQIISCSKPEETVDLRGPKSGGLDQKVSEEALKRGSEQYKTPTQPPAKIEPKTVENIEISGFGLFEAKNGEALDQGFVPNVALISKISASQIVIFGKDGKSWQYSSKAEAAPTAVASTVAVGPGSNLYSLPDNEFWIVSPSEVGRRKPNQVNTGANVTVERFSTSTLEGDKASLKVLFVSKDVLMLSVPTHVAIYDLREGKQSLVQIELEKAPGKLKGAVVTGAGMVEGGGFWLATPDDLYVLNPRVGSSEFNWKIASLSGKSLSAVKSMGLWLDPSHKVPLGDVLVLRDNKFYSISGAPIAGGTLAQ